MRAVEPLSLEEAPLEEVNKTTEDMVKRGSVLHNDEGGMSEANILKSNCKYNYQRNN